MQDSKEKSAITFADQVIAFNRNLDFHDSLPTGFRVLNPFIENPETMEVMSRFYHKYYNDHKERRFIIGINPGRHGAAITGIPFTDTKRMESVCGIKMESARTHEVSSVFVYDMIEEFGGAERFYKDFYINSPFPLAIVKKTKNGKWLNANYYDDPNLFDAVEDFMIESLKIHIQMGLVTSKVFSLGVKNFKFLEKLNKKANLFGEIIPLEHPRYIQQYKMKSRKLYIDKYIRILSEQEGKSD